MKYILIITLLLLAGCGKKVPDQVNPTFRPYYDKFAKDIAPMLFEPNIDFGQMDPINYGVPLLQCWPDKPPYIVVNKDFWDNASEGDREETLYHELGHCLYNLQHDATLLDDGCPASIMAPFLFGSTPCYQKHLSLYYDELKRQKSI